METLSSYLLRKIFLMPDGNRVIKRPFIELLIREINDHSQWRTKPEGQQTRAYKFLSPRNKTDKIDIDKMKRKAQSYPKIKVVFSAMCSIGKSLSLQ